MTLKHIKIFKEVCNQESITIAADRLNMAQPAVSLAIKELENFYGVKLFERLHRRLYITDEGKVLLQYGDTIIQQFDEVENSIRNGDYLSRLRVGANVSIGTSLLPKVLKAYEKENSNIIVTSYVNNSNIIEKKLLLNELDLAIIDDVTSSPSVKDEFLFEERMVAICTKTYASRFDQEITLEQLAKERLLLREQGSGSRDTIETVFRINGLTPQVYMESVSVSALIQAAAHDLGILILPERVLKSQKSEETFIRINLIDIQFKRKYYIIYNRNKYLSTSLQGFIRLTHELAEGMTINS